MDQETGWKELMRQAKSGDAEAQCRLGCKLDFGDDETECDKAAAREWYRRAAEQGNLTAMNNLGLMLKNGEGGPADLKAGLELLFRAAEAGDEYAQRNCGKACERGEIPGAGLPEAERWYRLAIAGGHREAIFDLGYLLSDLLPSPTAEQLAEAAQLYRKLADEGDCEACYNLAVHYDFGKGVPVNHRLAVKYYRIAAAQGHDMATYNLGCSYEHGRGVRQDRRKALSLYRRALELGDHWACGKIAYFYYEGWGGVRKSYRKSFEWDRNYFLKFRDVHAAYNLSVAYYSGRGVKRNLRKSFLWTKYAFTHGYSKNLNDLGYMYLKGIGTEKNPERAEYWLEKAVAANPDDDDALYNLGLLAQQAGDCRKAAAYFTRVLEIDPQDPYSHYRLGRIRLFGLDGSPDPAAAGFHLEAARKKLGCARRLLRSKRFQSRMGEKTE